MSLRVFWVVIATLATSVPVLAQNQDAVRLFEQSEIEFERGAFDRAHELLEAAYVLEPAPVLLYNIGRTREELGRIDEAVEAYDAFVAAAPEHEMAASARERAAQLRTRIADEPAETPPVHSDESPSSEAVDEGLHLPPLAIGLWVGAALMAGTGGLLIWWGQTTRDDADANPVQLEANTLYEDALRRARGGYASLALAAAFAVAGGLAFKFMRPRSQLSVTAHLTGVTLAGRW